ncbi:hypothetical protein B1810_08255 [Panacagrimonas perspica]|nr:hypothetical protein B1810_08255 [Panacagrimonas perspica]
MQPLRLSLSIAVPWIAQEDFAGGRATYRWREKWQFSGMRYAPPMGSVGERVSIPGRVRGEATSSRKTILQWDVRIHPSC